MSGPPRKPWNEKAGNQPHDHRYISGSGPISRAPSRREGNPIPEANPNWLPQARSWYNSLRLSGQSEFYESSDWATAIAAAQSFDIFLRTYNASVLAVFERLSARLGVTVVDRARARIELAEPEPADVDEEAADAVIIDWQQRLDSRRKD